MRFRAAWLVLALALSAAACEQKPADPLVQARTDCAKTDGDAAARVSACSTLLEQGDLKGADRAAALAHRGDAHVGAHETTPALRDFEAALELDQNNLDAAFGRASILIASGQLDAAQPLVARMVTAQYKLTETHTMNGRIALSRGEYNNAVSAFSAALSQDANYVPALALRGRAKERLGDAAGARTDYDVAISQDPTRSTEAYTWRCWMELRNKEDAGQTRADAEAAVRAQPQIVESHTCLGVVQLKASEWTDAKNSFDAALDLQPGDPTALFGRGIARRRAGDSHGSDDMNQAHEFDSHVREFFLSLGVVTY